MNSQGEEHRAVVKGAVLAEATFVRLTLSRRSGQDSTPWVRISVRPVLIRGERHLQFSYFDGKKDIAKNFSGAEAEGKLDEALALPFGHIHVQSVTGDLHVKITRKGRVLMSRGRPSREGLEPSLEHDRAKSHLLPADASDPLLRALGIVTERGGIRAGMQGKFHQINEFLRIIDQTLRVPTPPLPASGSEAGEASPRPADKANGRPEIRSRRLEVVDCGCGSAYLTFAVFHYLNHVRGVPARVVAVDTNEELIGKCGRLRDSLGWDGLEFRVARIAEYDPESAPEMVLSLHACDTATDEALAQGVRWRSRVVLAAPCCQHELHHELKAAAFQAILRHGILRERLADIVTDAFRALALRIVGYRTSVIEFVSPDSTSKNLMIRAERGLKPGAPASVQEYADLRLFWGVTPAIERMLGEELRLHLKERAWPP